MEFWNQLLLDVSNIDLLLGVKQVELLYKLSKKKYLLEILRVSTVS